LQNSIFEAVLDFLRQEAWPFHQLEGQPVVQVNFQGDNGRWGCIAQVVEPEKLFVFYSICPANTPPEKRPAMAEFICRANYGLLLGNFELDFEDGEVRFRTSLDLGVDRLSLALLKQAIYTNLIIMDRYLPGIMVINFGSLSPAEAITQVEQK
jgi:hypothetical protein